MINYNTLSKKVKANLLSYSNKLTLGLFRTDLKFVTQMIYGLTASSSSYLSDIARSLNESITIKKSIDRLSRNLNNFNQMGLVYNNYIQTIKPRINKDTIFCVDHSDIVKVASEKLEYLADIVDGSRDNSYAKGYYMTEITALNKNKQPISTYSNVWSQLEPGFISQNNILFKALDKNVENFGTSGTYVMDRGFDSNAVLRYLTKNKLKYIIRMKKTRKVIHQKKRKSIDNVVLNIKGKTNITVMFNDESYECKVSHTKVKLSGFKDDMTLVVMYGIGNIPFKLLTNKSIKSKQDLIKVVRDYLSRWRIEEYFKFKKQQFNFEKLLVRSISSIRNLNSFITFVIGYLGILSNDRDVYTIHIIKTGKSIKQKVQFWYYQIIRGIVEVVSIIKENINKEFIRIKPKRERNLFTINGIKI
jgi:hypothetical protein